MPRLRPISALAAGLFCAASVSAQIFIVDASNGPGTSFTTLTAAVAAAPDGGVLRVRSGTYTAFTLQAKGLSIVGEENAVVRIASRTNDQSIQVLSTSTQQPVLLKNLIFGDTLPYGGEVLFRDCRASVSCVELSIDPSPLSFVVPTRFRLELATNVLFDRCDFSSSLGMGTMPRMYALSSRVAMHRTMVTGLRGTSVTYGQPPAGTPALELGNSRCWSSASSFRGGEGASGCAGFFGCTSTSGVGGIGVRAMHRSQFLALRTPVFGGGGVPGFLHPSGGFVVASDGGTGIVLETGSSADFAGSRPLGGASQANAGAPSQVDATSTLRVDVAAKPSFADSSGEQVLGSTLKLELTARPAVLAVLHVAPTAELLAIDPVSPGSILVTGFPITSAFPVGPNGTYDYVFSIPPAYPLGRTGFAQFVTIDPATLEVWATIPLHVHVNH